jgi:hypothetical protein
MLTKACARPASVHACSKGVDVSADFYQLISYKYSWHCEPDLLNGQTLLDCVGRLFKAAAEQLEALNLR